MRIRWGWHRHGQSPLRSELQIAAVTSPPNVDGGSVSCRRSYRGRNYASDGDLPYTIAQTMRGIIMVAAKTQSRDHEARCRHPTRRVPLADPNGKPSRSAVRSGRCKRLLFTRSRGEPTLGAPFSGYETPSYSLKQARLQGEGAIHPSHKRR